MYFRQNPEDRKQKLAEYQLRQEKEEADKLELKNNLAKEYGVVGNPKLDRCFDLAWDFGHSAGFSEVRFYFGELVELIIPEE